MMISLPLRQSKFLIFLFFLVLNAQPTYLLSNCSTSGNYTANSPYKSNLASLLSVLRFKSSSNYGFYNYTSGSSLTTTVYGEYLCRRDFSSSTCEACVSESSINILLECPVQNEAIIWYAACFLRYSNRNIFSIYDDILFAWSETNDTMLYPHSFMNTVEYRMDQLIREAFSTSSYFAEERYHVISFEEYDLHGLVQCTPDLDKYDCYRCLKSAYNETEVRCYGKRLALMYTTNCMLTYEATISASPPPPPLSFPPWENIPDSPPPPPPPPPLSLYAGENIPDSNDKISLKLKGKVFRKIIASVIAAVILILAICLCSLCCCCIKKKHQTQERGTSIELTPTNDVDNPIVDQTMAKTESP